MLQPLTNRPPALSGNPRSVLNHERTCASTSVADCSNVATFGLSPEASMSATMPSGVPVPVTHPQNRGWRLPWGYDRTFRTKSP